MSGTSVARVAGFVLAGVLAGCSSEPGPESQLTPIVRLTPVVSDELLSRDTNARLRNCLFIILDTTHAPHSSAWGYKRNTTPNIDILAKHGVRFAQTFSQAPATLPSALSYLTGQYPESPPTEDPDSLRLKDSATTLAGSFSEAGFNTFGFSENPYVSETWGFERGFDHWTYTNPLPADDLSNRDHAATLNLLDEAFTKIDASPDTPWFTYLHLFRPHHPYLAPEPYGTIFMNEDHKAAASPKVEAALFLGVSDKEVNKVLDAMEDKIAYIMSSYDGNLAYVDHLIGKLLARLNAIDALQNTLVIIASDHGEAFMQHGRVLHGNDLYEEMLHVPLIIWAPSMENFSARVVDQSVSMLDLFPTLVDAFALADNDALQGQSLAPFLSGDTVDPSPALFAQTKAADKVSVRMGDLKLIATTDPVERTVTDYSVFDLEKDPGEHTNIRTPNQPFQTLLDTATRYIAAWPERTDTTPEPIPEDQLDQLRAIGYIE